MDLADILAPMGEQAFLDGYWGQMPLHLPADPARAAPIAWDDLNALLAQRSHWTADRFKLLMNSRPVDPAHYLTDAPGRPLTGDPARIEHFLAIGASMVLDHVEDLLPDVRAIADMLGERFGALVGANCYASFQGVQAFASHYDVHEVFAMQCAGEKRWRIYANRAQSPLETPQGADAQAWIDGAKGPVLMEVTLRPGELLYIPRGYFHDAIATDSHSLHLTFGIAPPSGRLIFQLLEDLALSDPAFRDYLPDARARGGGDLRERLAGLGQRLGDLAASDALFDAVALHQRKLVQPAHALSLPTRPALDFFARTQRAASVERDAQGAWLVAAGQRAALGLDADAVEWMLKRPAFSTQEARAQFSWHPAADIDAAIARLAQAGLVESYRPRI